MKMFELIFLWMMINLTAFWFADCFVENASSSVWTYSSTTFYWTSYKTNKMNI